MARATLKDVAELAGVSAATVSYVLSGKRTISEETKARVLEAIEQLDYVPDLNARGLSMRDSKLIGVVVPQTEPGERLMFQNSFYSEVLGSIEYYARQKGYHILISATDANESYLTLARQRNLDGIIVIGMYPDEFYHEMKKTQIPIVLIDSYCNDHYYHNIRIDDAYGSYLATRHLLEKGHRDIAFFSGQMKENGVMKKRLLGYQQALDEFRVEFKGEYVFEGQIDYQSGVELAGKLTASSQGITAIVAAADILAIGAVKGLYEAGKTVPGDYSIVGFDDLEISQYLTPGLTTVKQQISLKGQKAVELLLKHIESPSLPKQEEILPLELVERGSVKKIN
ncbi:MAG: LacI family transcriptional regulator [Clostridia bacterium]|nr:LacI family DNA-binding transcriptional regulator [Oscillospiraceae bacterium]MBS5432699.1 LacI family DNA-binding transcriptional regulator [Bacillota bacterium]PWM15586.1 MAG: LacI family transcriptional regulator [Clostridia bacterium]